MGFNLFSYDDNAGWQAANDAAGTADRNYGQLGSQLGGDLGALRRRANGEDSLSAEALRQGNQQIQAGQASFAAGASPQNSTIAALTASRNAMTAGAGLNGQMATAGIQERQGAQDALVQAMLRRQQMEAQREQEQRQMALASTPKSWWDRFGGALTGAAQLYTSTRPPARPPGT